MRRGLPAACVALLLAACSSASYAPSTDRPGLAPYRGEVAVLERLPPPGSFLRVGIVVTEGGDLTNRSMLMRRLKKEAAARGADAIVLQTPARNPDLYAKKDAKFAAWAIRRKR